MGRSPKAEVQITAESRSLGAKLREARAQFTRFGGALKKEVFGKVLFDGPKASAHMMGQLGAQAVGRGLGFFEEQARGVFEFNDALVNLQIAARKTPEETQEIGKAVRLVAAETGLASETVLQGAQSWVDLAGAEKYSIDVMRVLARAARASNTEIGAMVTTMYGLENSMHIKPAEMEDTLSGLINQSKDGHIHFKQMADEMIGLLPKFARYGVTGRQGAIELGAMFQIVRSGSKGAEETTTKLDGIFRGLLRNSKLFRKAGVEVFNIGKDGTKTLKPFSEIWAQIERKSGKLMKDPTKMIRTFGRGDGEAGMRLLIEMHDEYKKLVEAGQVNGTVAEDLATKTESAGGRIAIVMEVVKNKVADAFTVERVDAFVNALEGIPDKLEGIAKAVGVVSDALGFFYHVGQKVRGILDENANNNPFKEVQDVQLIQQLGGFENDDPKIKARVQAARNDLASSRAYDRATQEIMGSEVNDRTSPASIERAILAKFAPNSAEGRGEQIAGERYLRAAKVTDADAQAIYAKAMAAALKDTFVPKVIDAIREGFATSRTEVKADGQAIVDVHRGSRAHARRPGG